MKERIGITTTVPVEVILAAGLVPVDLNNIFIGGDSPAAMVSAAEQRGFPQNICAWIKGLYAAAEKEGIKKVVGVLRGDCSSTEKLLEIWSQEGVETIPFYFPARPDPEAMKRELERFASALGTGLNQAEEVRRGLRPVREMLERLDELTWREGKVSSFENHLWLVSASDFQGDPEKFAARLRAFLEEAEARPPRDNFLRLGFLGVPPIVPELYDFLEERGARVVFNEIQRQFAMPGRHESLADQYTAYTYPYDTFYRVEDIKREVERRRIQGLIHYAQVFCHRQLESLVLRALLPVPVLILEADKPGPLEPRLRTRIEAFLEQLSASRGL